MTAVYQFLAIHDGIHQTILEDLKRYAEMGLFPTVYVKRELSTEETVELESKINEAMSLMKDQDDKIESSLLTYMHQMKILGTVGL
jgi:hypothetical protein